MTQIICWELSVGGDSNNHQCCSIEKNAIKIDSEQQHLLNISHNKLIYAPVMVCETTWPQIKETGSADVTSRWTLHLKFARMSSTMARKIPE